MLVLIVFLYLSTVGNILSQDIVVLQVKTEPVVVILNNTPLNGRNVPDSRTSLTAGPDTVNRIKKLEKTAITVETDQKEWLWWFNFVDNKTMNMSNKVNKKDNQISQSKGNDTVTGGNNQHSNNKTLVEGFQKPTDLEGMKTTNVTFDNRAGINGDGCAEGYVKVDGKCVKEIK